MARLWTSGFEGQHYLLEGLSSSSSASPYLTYDTATKRIAGTRASAKCDSTATPAAAFVHLSFSSTNGRYYRFRGYFKRSSTTAQTSMLIASFRNNTGVSQLEVRLDGSNRLQLYNANSAANIGSPSAALDTNWHRLELGIMVFGSGTLNCYAELKLDGVSIASSTVQTFSTTALGGLRFGWYNAPSANEQIWYDDCCLNDDQGTDQNSWPDAGTVWLLLPTSDNARGAGWLDDNAATTNLWDALNNLPPTGVTQAPATMPATAQIYNVTSGTGQNMDVNMQTYTAAGIGSDEVVKLVQMWVYAGLAVATTRAVNAYIVSNPAETTPATFNITAAIAGTWPTNWMYQGRTLIYNPTVTKGTAPVARVSKEVNNVAAVMFCYAGIVVETQPVTATKRAVGRARIAIQTAKRGIGRVLLSVQAIKRATGRMRLQGATLSTRRAAGRARIVIQVARRVAGRVLMGLSTRLRASGRVRLAIRTIDRATGRARITVRMTRRATGRLLFGLTTIRRAVGRLSLRIQVQKRASGRLRLVIQGIRRASGRVRFAIRTTRRASGRLSIGLVALKRATGRARLRGQAIRRAVGRMRLSAGNVSVRRAVGRMRLRATATWRAIGRARLGLSITKRASGRLRVSIRLTRRGVGRTKLVIAVFKRASGRLRLRAQVFRRAMGRARVIVQGVISYRARGRARLSARGKRQASGRVIIHILPVSNVIVVGARGNTVSEGSRGILRVESERGNVITEGARGTVVVGGNKGTIIVEEN